MPTSRMRNFIAWFGLTGIAVTAAFMAGRATSRVEPPAGRGSVDLPGPIATTQAGDSEPVPGDALKLDHKTLRVVNTFTARQIPLNLYRRANELAAFDQTADVGQLRESLRADLRNGVYSLAMGAQGWGVTGLNVNALRQVSTYYAVLPDPNLDERARAWLSAYPAYSDAELAESQCEDPVFTLARGHPTPVRR